MDNKLTQSQGIEDKKRIEQAAEQWVNLVLEQIKHKRYAIAKVDNTNKYIQDKNEKLYQSA